MLLSSILPRSTHPEQLSFADLEPAPATETRSRAVTLTTEEAALALPTGLPPEADLTAEASALAFLKTRLAQLGALPAAAPQTAVSIERARDDWLRRLQAAGGARARSPPTGSRSTTCSPGAGDRDRSVFEESTIVDYLADYQRRARPGAGDLLPTLRPAASLRALAEPPQRPPGPVPRARSAAEAAAGGRLADRARSSRGCSRPPRTASAARRPRRA